ncbi:hypothetical protein I5M32_08855 [Pedobacter sp. SD-b]|uniref:Outer membrane protein beta-barrel domain-containing protein n=1 Tax=Pedobacter segetis TaxID=2793069 RepID=A0ABS1BL66_9SPHI|nr:hypothetical protein [Pedobacter segetis]MBK0383066.1 hypothetical protein [Pedobacter segetis]
MKKLFHGILIYLFCLSKVFAQNGAFSKTDKLLNIGIGVNSFYDNGIPFGASFEKGINDNISVGGNFDYLATDFGASGVNSKFTAIYLAARGSYHFNNLLKVNNKHIDLYAGPSLGYRIFSWKDDFGGSLGNKYGSGLFIGIHIGGKYYFNDKIGVFLELGDVGSTNARLGLAIKF